MDRLMLSQERAALIEAEMIYRESMLPYEVETPHLDRFEEQLMEEAELEAD